MAKTSRLTAAYSPFEGPQLSDPYLIWREARETSPVFWSDQLDAWVVSRFETVKSVLGRPTVFVNEGVTTPVTPPPPAAAAILARGFSAGELRPTVTRDGPEHARLRRLLLSLLTPRAIGTVEVRARDIGNALIDTFIDDGKADIVSQFSLKLPLTVVLELIGVSGISFETVHKWTNSMVSMFWGRLSDEEYIVAAHNAIEYQEYLSNLVDDARITPRDDLISNLVGLDTGDDAPLTQGEIVGVMMGLVSAGHETVMNLISLTLFTCLKQPEVWNAMRRSADAIPAVIEESLRANSPAHSVWRKAAADTLLEDAYIHAGDRVSLVLASANRDAASFPDPDLFEIDRKLAAPHLAFGRGVHYCVGAPLARLEARVAFEVLTRRLPHMTIAADYVPRFEPSSVLRFLKTLDVVWPK